LISEAAASRQHTIRQKKSGRSRLRGIGVVPKVRLSVAVAAVAFPS
jgi:hypothetical protein